MPFPAITEEGLRAQIDRFYGLARQDDLLGPLFEQAIQDWPPHIATITDFWIQAMLGERRYAGNPVAAHARHPIQPAMFERWLDLWGQTARELFAPEPAAALQAKAEMIGRSLSLALFYRPGDPASGQR